VSGMFTRFEGTDVVIMTAIGLHKSEGSVIITLNTQGSRIIVGDMQETLFFAVY
jgi:hypothetical protein